MKPRISGLIGIVALLASTALACHNDPTAEGVGSPFAVVLDFSSLTLDQGTSAQVVARIVDSRFTPLTGDITFSSCNAAATVALDPTFVPEPPTAKRATIAAVGADAGCIVASAAGAKPDSVSLIVLPTSFAGALSGTSANAGTVLTIASTAALKFDTAAVTVTFGGGVVAPFASKTADQLQVLVPFSDPGPLSITGVVVTYVAGLTVTLPTAASFTQTGGDPFPGANEWQTAPDITSLLPGAGQSSLFLAAPPSSNPAGTCPEERFAFGPSGPCALLRFTLAAPTTISFEVDWDGPSADVDVVICNDSTAAAYATFAPCVADGFAGAGSSKPEVAGGVSYPAGTYWVAIQDYEGTGVRNYFIKAEVQ
jgi:hypothetical protein